MIVLLIVGLVVILLAVAVAATIGYSLDTLDLTDQHRFCQLGIFAGDAEIPLTLITALWQATATPVMSDAEVADHVVVAVIAGHLIVAQSAPHAIITAAARFTVIAADRR